MSKLERNLRHGRRIVASSSAVYAAGNQPVVLQSLWAALQERATPNTRTQEEDTFDVIADQFVSEEHPALRDSPTRSPSSPMMENTVHKKINRIPAMVEDVIMRLFEDVCCDTDSRPDTRVVFEIQTAVSRKLVKCFQSTTFSSAVENSVNNFVPHPLRVDAVTARLVDDPFVTVPVDKYFKHEFEKSSFDKVKTEERFGKLAEALQNKKTKKEDWNPTKRMDLCRSSSPLRYVFDNKKTIPET